MSDLKNCKSCEKEVSKKAKVCPHCGVKLKMGKMMKLIIGVGVIIVAGAVFGLTDEEKAAKMADTLNITANAQASNLAPSGNLASHFALNSKNTDIQRSSVPFRAKANTPASQQFGSDSGDVILSVKDLAKTIQEIQARGSTNMKTWISAKLKRWKIFLSSLMVVTAAIHGQRNSAI